MCKRTAGDIVYTNIHKFCNIFLCYVSTALGFGSAGGKSYSFLHILNTHVIQHNDYYGENIAYYQKEIEFEAKIFQDLLDIKNGIKHPMRGLRYQESSFKKQYKKWVREDFNVQGYEVIEERFHNLCTKWTEYGADTAQVTFTPQMLEEYFK